MANEKDIWTVEHVKSLAPDDASIPAAQKVLKKGGFGTVDATADGRGWWVVCRGLTGTYQVTVRREEGDTGDYECQCNCLSYKNPCKHALALLLYLVDHPELRAAVEAPKTAASDFEGLLRGAFREHTDDTPRLVFADFLEENDQPDRAALIRYQCERARLKSGARRARELDRLIKPLVARLKQQIGPLPQGMTCGFVRGFLRLESHAGHFAETGSLPARVLNLFRDGWVESLATYLSFRHDDGSLALAAQVGELDVSMYPLTDEWLVGLVADTAAARASGRLVRVKVNSINKKALTRLLQAERGKAVDLSGDLGPTRDYYNIDARTFNQLLQFGRLSGARDLSIRSSGDLGDTEVAALLTADLSALRNLQLAGWALTRAATEALADGPAVTKLTTLRLPQCGLKGTAVSVLVSGPLFARMKVLDLSWNPIGKACVTALLEAEVPAKLKELVLRDCRLSADDKKKLKRKYGPRVKV